MKHYFITLLAACVFYGAQAQTNLSPEVNAFLGKEKSTAKFLNKHPKQTIVTLRLKDDAKPADIASKVEALGAEVKVTLGNQMTVALTADQIKEIAQIEGVDIVERIKGVTPRTDVSRAVTHTNEVLDGTGTNLPQAYNGEGVIIALIDNGYDFTSPVFKDANNNLRIKSVYLPGNSQGKAHKATIDGKEADGALFDTPDLILDLDKLYDDAGSHGTHCASIAAGSSIAGVNGLSGKPLGGMAPKSDIILLNTTADDVQKKKYGADAASDLNTSLCLKYISEYAKAQKKPVVLSWSENIHDGFHDGTGAEAQAIRNFCNEGNIAVICASNEGNDSMHVHKTVNNGETIKLMIDKAQVDPKSFTFFVTQKPVSMRFGIYDTATNKEVFLSDKISSTEKLNIFVDTEDGPDSESSDYERQLYEKMKDLFEGNFSLTFSAGTGKDTKNNDRYYVRAGFIVNGAEMKNNKYHFVLYFSPEESSEMFSWCDNTGYMKYNGFTEGTASVSMGILSTTGEAVTIGGWAAQNKTLNIRDASGEVVDKDIKVNDIYTDSSWGTDYAGHKIPDACTPAVNVIAALNSQLPSKKLERTTVSVEKSFNNQYKNQTEPQYYLWGPMSGTSMATPTAAGIVALWVQAAKDKGLTLTNANIKDIIRHSCDVDEYTQALPHRFGAGKINAYKGLLYVLNLTTSIKELSQHQPSNVNFRVTNGQLITEGAEDGTTVTLYNLSGAVVRKTTVQAGSVSLSGLKKGVYAVQLGKLGSTLIRL